jgi:hypothetical protein
MDRLEGGVWSAGTLPWRVHPRLRHPSCRGPAAVQAADDPDETTRGETTMRFLSMIRLQETGRMPSEQLMSDMGRLIEQMTREGTLVDTAGLRPSAEGVRVRLHRGRLSTTDGPFTESKEIIGGYAILEADSMAHAVELAKRFLALHGDDWDLECEVRQMEGHDGERCGAADAMAAGAA